MTETITFFAILFVSMAPAVMLWLVVRPAKQRDDLKDNDE